MINKKKIKPAIRTLQDKVNEFNIKYQCELDLNKFIDEVNKESKKGNLNAWSDVYKSTFLDLYKKTAQNTVLGKRNSPLSGEEMLESFEYDVMTKFVVACTNVGEYIPTAKYAGMTNREACTLMKNTLNDIPNTSYSNVARNQYANGEIRIRDMVRFTRGAIDNGNIQNNVEAQKRIMGYAIALEKINDSRSKWWRTIHRFRNKAEQRDAALMRNLLREAIGDNAYRQAEQAAIESVAAYSKEVESLNNAIDAHDLVNNDDEFDLNDSVSDLGDDSIDYGMEEEARFGPDRKKAEDLVEPIFIDAFDEKYADHEKQRVEEFKKANEQYLKDYKPRVK